MLLLLLLLSSTTAHAVAAESNPRALCITIFEAEKSKNNNCKKAFHLMTLKISFPVAQRKMV
jgi:hypothetical protein